MQNLLAAQLAHGFALPTESDPSPAEQLADEIKSANDRGDFQELGGQATDICIWARADSGDSEPVVTAQIEALVDGGEMLVETYENLSERFAELAERFASKAKTMRKRGW